jgi:hypothetical protein
MRTLPRVGLTGTVVVFVAACSGSASVPSNTESDRGGPTDAGDVGGRPVPDVADDAPSDETTSDTSSDADETADDSLRIDAVTTDAFTRPEVRPSDATEEPADTDVSDVVSDVGSGPERVLRGNHDCLNYEIRVSDTEFSLKVDDIRVTYLVQNVCTIPYSVRVPHFSEFFAIGLHRDGEPWIFLPDCPGTGSEYDYTFTPEGGGVNRGWIWSATDHEARLARCGVEFDPDASYTIVGYGATQLDLLDPVGYSEVFVMTDPIEINLRL